MKIIKKTSSPKKTIIIAIVILFFVTATVIALEKAQVTDFIKSNPTTYSGPTEAEVKKQNRTEQGAKQDFIESPDPTPAPSAPASLELSAKQETDGNITVLTKLQGIDSGSCVLTVTNAGITNTQTADVIYQPDFSSCAGFSIQKDKLGSGNWNIKLSLASNETLEKVISLQVN